MRLAAVALVCVAAAAQEPRRAKLPGFDGSVLQRAIDGAKEGSTVAVSRGRYTLARPLVLRSAVTLKGVKRDQVVVQIEARTGPAIIVEGCRKGAVESMTLLHTGRRDGGMHAIVSTRNSNFTVRDCLVKNSGLDGIRTHGRGRVGIEKCRIEGSRRHGVYATGRKHEIVVKECVLARNGDRKARRGREGAGIQFHDRARGVAEGCRCSESSWGIRVTGRGTRGLLVKNSCTRNHTGIKFDREAGGECTGNVCTLNDRYGVHLGRRMGEGPTLKGNQLAGNGHGGLKRD